MTGTVKALDAEAKCNRLVSEVERLRSALEEIENPIFFMQKRADDEGRQIDGAESVRLANDANYLRRIARDALRLCVNQAAADSPTWKGAAQ